MPATFFARFSGANTLAVSFDAGAFGDRDSRRQWINDLHDSSGRETR